MSLRVATVISDVALCSASVPALIAALLCNYLNFNSGLSLDSNSPVACCNLPFVIPPLSSHM